MATTVVTVLIDDLDGTTADNTVRFSIDGTEYDIDLSASNEAELREILARYMAAGRKAGRKSRRAVRPKQKAGPIAATPSIREWAQRNGYPASRRGRLPAEILEAHEKATA